MQSALINYVSNRGTRKAATYLKAVSFAAVLLALVCAGIGRPASAQAKIAAGSGLEAAALPEVQTADGIVQGAVDSSGIRSFKGIPYAQPPINNLRWREPQPVTRWDYVRPAAEFALRPMQLHSFPDQLFRSVGMSEDCLYLNVWTPATSSKEHLPVLVYFYGGGFTTGSGDETRYDGASMARHGMVMVTLNYRLGVFGFMAHPELTKESPSHASGNYGLLDQVAALKWVRANIAQFGGDPKRVTIGGESAGSFSVSLLMASPLSKGLFAQASGESGSMLGTHPTESLADAEQAGAAFANAIGAPSLATLRTIPAEQLLQLAGEKLFQVDGEKQAPDFGPIVDGVMLPAQPSTIYNTGQEAHVPLLAGWNSAEVGPDSVLEGEQPSPTALDANIARLYGSNAPQVQAVYPSSTPEDADLAARDLASDRFIAYSTWNWIDTQERTGGNNPVYRYIYAHPLPPPIPMYTPQLPESNPAPVPSFIPPGASHASEIAYALGNLNLYNYYAWTPADYQVSATIQSYFANFILTGNPNGAGLPQWPTLQTQPPRVMRIDVTSQAVPEQHRDRYLALKAVARKEH